MATSGASLAIIRGILDGGDAAMLRKYQNPTLEIRDDVKRPYYFIRVSVPKITSAGRVLERERRCLGFVDEISKKEALKLRAALLEVVNQGRVLVQAQVRFRDLAQRFLDVRVPQLGAATQANYRTLIENHILPAFGNMRLCDIERAQIEEWLSLKAQPTVVKLTTGEIVEKPGLSWWTRSGLRGTLGAIFSAGREWKIWEFENPTIGVRIGRKIEAREKRLLTGEQLARLIASLSGQVRFMVLIMLGTGLRVSEVLGLRWRDIDLDAGTLRVEKRWYRGDLDEPKTEPSRRMRQLGPLVDEFKRAYPGPQARDLFVFLGENGATPPDERDLLRYELRPVLKRLGMYFKGFGWHAFRRIFLTTLQTIGGASPMEAQRAAGHAALRTTFQYFLSDAERERAQVERILSDIIGPPVKGKPQ